MVTDRLLPVRRKFSPTRGTNRKRKYAPKSRSARHVEDVPSESDEEAVPWDGDGLSSDDSVSSDTPAPTKRVRISTITTRSSTRASTSNVGIPDTPNSPSPALVTIRPSSPASSIDNRIPTGHTAPSLADITAVTSDRPVDPSGTSTDATDVDRSDSGDTRVSGEALSAPPTKVGQIRPNETEAVPATATEATHAIELVGAITTTANTMSVVPLSALSNAIDIKRVPAFLCSHGKGNRRVNIFEYLNEVRDSHFRRVLFHYINFEDNDKSGASGSLSTTTRPIAIGQWLSKARPAALPDSVNDKPSLSVFAESVLVWWGSLQPSWRSFERGVVSRTIEGDWEGLHSPRINGMLNVVILVYWWARALEEQRLEGSVRADYEFFADDVAWVLSCLCN